MINMAVVGAGLWAQEHGRIFQEMKEARPVAICDLNRERAESFAARYGIDPAQVYTDHREMLKHAKCDAVSIVTPDFLHADIAVDCANAKKHMLIEKPLATKREDVLRILDAADKNKVRIMVDMHNRWSPPFNNAKAILASGKMGRPINAYFRLNDVKSVATDMLSWSAKSSILWFLGSHLLDTLVWLLGSYPREIYARSSQGVLNDLGVDTVDVYQASIEFDNGVIAQTENGWITPNGNPCVNDIKFNVVCEKGKIDIDASSNNLLQVTTDERMDTGDCIVSNRVFDYYKGFAYESIRSFVEKLESGEEFYVPLKDAAQVVIALLEIMESARTGKPIVCEKL